MLPIRECPPAGEIPVCPARQGVTLADSPGTAPAPGGHPGAAAPERGTSMSGPDSLSVADLLARAKHHSPDDLDRLFAACRNYLGIVARAQVESWLQAKVDASDLIQQTLLEAYRDFAHFRGTTEAEWMAWLRRILANNAANFVRQYRGTAKRQARREVALGRPGDGSSAGGFLGPADECETPTQRPLGEHRS